MDFICFAVIRGAVLGISAVSATFLENFPAVLLGLGSCFGDFSGFSYFFGEFSSCFAVIRGAVLGISAVSAVKSKFVCKFIFQLCGFIYATFIFKRFD